MSDVRSGERGRWRTFSERTIRYDPQVWLSQVDVQRPDGVRLWHEVVRLRRSVAVLLVDDADRVLLLWRHRFIADRWGWELPGGLTEDGEEPGRTAMRELEEETGYRADRITRLLSFQPMAGRVDAEHVLFGASEAVRVGEPVEANEAARMEWIPIAALSKMIAAGLVWNSGTLIGLLHLVAFRPPDRP